MQNTDLFPSLDGPTTYLLVAKWEGLWTIRLPWRIVPTLQKTAAEVILVDGDKTEMALLPKGDRVAGRTPGREVRSTMERLRLLLPPGKQDIDSVYSMEQDRGTYTRRVAPLARRKGRRTTCTPSAHHLFPVAAERQPRKCLFYIFWMMMLHGS